MKNPARTDYSPSTTAGTVYLVGAGPGDPGLITVRGMQCLEAADVVVYDRLVDDRLLERVTESAELIDVGKAPGEGRNRQSQVDAILIRQAREGKRVVRLKGGDPFVFGRGGEEAEALSQAGIPFEVVPGVTSATAVPAYAGIPMTHRNLASSYTVVTGSEAPGKHEGSVAWDRVAHGDGTLVVLMGWKSLASIVATLIREGLPAHTPAAVVQWGSEPYQRSAVGTLSDIVEKARQERLSPPVVIVIGQVVRLREKLRWYDNRPLFGRRVLVTRSRAQAGAVSEMLTREGAQPVELPTIEIRRLEDSTKLDAALRTLSRYEWVLFLSTNAVQAVFERLGALGLDARAFSQAKIAAIGRSTGAELRERGIVADWVAQEFSSSGVLAGLAERGIANVNLLLPRADIGGERLPRSLAALGATVDEVTAYRTVKPEGAGPRLAQILSAGIDVAVFTSSSTVNNLVDLLGGDLDKLSRARIACIGPTTAATATDAGLTVDIIARESTVAGLVQAIKEYYTQEAPSHD